VITAAKALRTEGKSIREVTALLSSAGFRNRKLKPFGKTEVANILKAA
jgi:hypothetical protein